MNPEFQNRFQKYLVFLILSIFFFFYCSISSVHAGMEDSATFILMANTWGVSHPPGYPLFAILGNLFSNIPISTIAFRVHLLNIVLGVFSLYFLLEICFFFTKNFWASLVAILVFGFSQTFVFQTVSAEVYGLYLFLSLFLIFWILECRTNKHFFFVFGLLIGLSLANHWPLFVLGFNIYLLAYLQFPKSLGKENEIGNSKNSTLEKIYALFTNKKLVLGLVLGLTPYLHLVLSQFYTEYFFYFKIDSLKDFISYVLRREQSVTDSLETWRFVESFYFLRSLLNSLYQEFGFVFFVLGVAGLVISFFQKKTVFSFLLVAIFSTPFLLLILWRTEFNSFTEELFRNWMLLSFAGLSLGLALGIDFVQRFDFRANALRQNISKPFPFSNLLLFGILFVFVFQLVWSNRNFYSQQRNDSFAFAYADVILSTLPKNSVLLVNTDEDSGSQIYISQKYFGLRKDVIISSALGAVFPHRIFERNKDDLNLRRIKLLNFITSQIAQNRRVFTTKKFGIFDEKVQFPMNYVPYGPLFLVTESKELSENNLFFPDDSLEKSKVFLDGILQNGYDSHWIRYRRAAIGNVCHILLASQREHPIFFKEEPCMRLFAQYNHSILKNYTHADELYHSLIRLQAKDSYISEKTSIAREFLLNRIFLFNTSKEKQIGILQEAVDLVFPIAILYPVCKNQLAKSIFELSKQVPIYFDRFAFFQNFGNCNF